MGGSGWAVRGLECCASFLRPSPVYSASSGSLISGLPPPGRLMRQADHAIRRNRRVGAEATIRRRPPRGLLVIIRRDLRPFGKALSSRPLSSRARVCVRLPPVVGADRNPSQDDAPPCDACGRALHVRNSPRHDRGSLRLLRRASQAQPATRLTCKYNMRNYL